MDIAELISTPTKKKVLANLLIKQYSTRVELADDTDVTKATLTNISKELIKKNIILEDGEIYNGNVGRRQKRLTLVPDAFYALGIDIGWSDTRVVAINAKLEIVFEQELSYSSFNEGVIDEILEVVHDFSRTNDYSKVLGVGLLIPGVIQAGKSVFLSSYNIKERLEKALHRKVIFYNNIRGLALTESFLEKNSKNFLLVKYGPGVGSVISLDGGVLEGIHNRAGEIGHISWNSHSDHICPTCNKRGCLESEIHYRNLDSKIPYTSENNSVETKKEILRKNHDLLIRNIGELAKAISYAVDIIDPALLIVAGLIFTDDFMYDCLVKEITSLTSTIEAKDIHRIDNYEDKVSKAAAIIVYSELFK